MILLSFGWPRPPILLWHFSSTAHYVARCWGISWSNLEHGLVGPHFSSSCSLSAKPCLIALGSASSYPWRQVPPDWKLWHALAQPAVRLSPCGAITPKWLASLSRRLRLRRHRLCRAAFRIPRARLRPSSPRLGDRCLRQRSLLPLCMEPALRPCSLVRASSALAPT